MKITDPEVIKNGEKDLIDSVQKDLDLDAVRDILKERMAVAALGSKGGQIVIHDNQIAFRLDFEVNLSGSLLFDREGNFIDTPLGDPEAQDQDAQNQADLDMPDLEDLAEADLEPNDDESEADFALPEMEDIDNDTALDEEMSPEGDLVDDISIDLPDYDLEDDDLPGDGLEDDPDPELELEALEEEECLTENLELEPEDNNGIDPEDPKAQDLDDDINDILKESRDFWEQKK
ncbi:MAG: hypothetical protein HUN05_11915 [Desulfobacter sp.]|nr:MAG: hypothetical protein HUN05_11915 [Desulfobacter sp.]